MLAHLADIHLEPHHRKYHQQRKDRIEVHRH
ncbi:Uncharacterised protein [Vibrio cholerae]|nr:Uncharacterised protein [Vibrio cholerae]CSC53738.1 Uncharacterised protein [Vibrio cholerae]